MKLNLKQLQAVVNLRASSDFKAFIAAIADEGETTVQQLIYAQDNVGIAQGRAQLVTEILKAVSEAPERLENMLKHQEPR